MGERGRVDIRLFQLAELSANLVPKALNPPKQRRYRTKAQPPTAASGGRGSSKKRRACEK